MGIRYRKDEVELLYKINQSGDSERESLLARLPKYQNQFESLCFSLSLSNFPINQRTPHTDLLSVLLDLMREVSHGQENRRSKMKKKLRREFHLGYGLKEKNKKTDEKDEKSDEGVTDLEKY